METPKYIIDVHSHIYLPRYVDILRSRNSVPYIQSSTAHNGPPIDRLLILDQEPSGGRPVGPQYWDRQEKLNFMDKHGIDVSIVSLANPWLDFLSAHEARTLASELNQDLEEYCSTSPNVGNCSLKRLYGFGVLPLVPDITTDELLNEMNKISNLPHLRGLIIGTRGIGNGLDDEALDPLWAVAETTKLVVFIHPHYGIDGKSWGNKDNGHVLPLALGFPFESTIAVTRLILSGVFDRFPDLRFLLAHSGGSLPQLSSRISSCIKHDSVVASKLEHDARYYVGKLYFDAVSYGSEELGFVSDVISRSKNFESGVTAPQTVVRAAGSGRMLFGTDHPFFPPLSYSQLWDSVTDNLHAIASVDGWSKTDRDGVLGGNALTLFRLLEQEQHTK